MNQIKFTCTSLPSGKKGVLTPNSDGYYVMPVGGLNCFNSAGHYYPYEEARDIFEQSSTFMRRVNTGCLNGELGHPKPGPNESMDSPSFMRRVMTIDERNICVHYKSIWLDLNSIKDSLGRPVVAIMAELKPSGYKASALERSINNPCEDTCFSIRSFTDDIRVRGVVHRYMREAVTFDHVTEPGINFARKYRSPALEEFSDSGVYMESDVSKETLEQAIAPVNGIAMEEASMVAESLFKALKWDVSHLNGPKFLTW